MKHEKIIDELFRKMFRDENMTDEEYGKFINETFIKSGLTKQGMSDDLETGVKNGHSIENQMGMIAKIFNIDKS